MFTRKAQRHERRYDIATCVRNVWRFKRAIHHDEGEKRKFVVDVSVCLSPGYGSNDRRSRDRNSGVSSLIFVGRALRSPTAYERGINYPKYASRSWVPSTVSLPLSLFCSLAVSFCLSFYSLLILLLLNRLIHPLRQSLPVVAVHPSSLTVTFSHSLSPTAANVYNDFSWWDDTGSEVRTAEPDVHSMESLSSGATVLRWLRVYTSFTLLARRKSAPFEQLTPAPAFARTRVAREQLAWKARAEERIYESAMLGGKLIQCRKRRFRECVTTLSGYM